MLLVSKNILIVESDADLAGNMRAELERLGFGVNDTSDGKGSLDLMRQSRPDLVVLAVELAGGQNGYLLCSKIKKDSDLKDIPIVIVGAPDGFSAHSKLKNTRANDYVAKPLDLQLFIESVGNLIGFPEAPNSTDGSTAFELSKDDAVEELSSADVELEEEVTINDPELDIIDAAFDIGEGGDQAAEGEPFPPPPVRETQLPPSPPSPSELQSLRHKIAQLEQQLGDATRRAAEAENRALTLKAELDAKPATAGRAGTKTDKEYLSLKEALTKKDREIHQLHTELSEKGKEILDLRDRENQFDQQNTAIADELANVQEQLQRAQEEISEVRAQAERYEVERQQAQGESAELKGELEALRAELEDRQQRVAGNEEVKERLRQAVAQVLQMLEE